MNKIAIVTRADDNIKEMTDITFLSIKSYASKVGADFIVLSDPPPFLTSDNKPHYRILKVGDLLNKYDRILCIDSDVIINKSCPNIFNIVPEDKIGSIYEDKGSRRSSRLDLIRNIQRHWGEVGWKEGYTNAGTFLVSKQHKNIFTPHEGQYWLDWGSADLHLSYNIHKYKHKVHELDFRWNHMTMFSESWNGNPNRFESYIIHYAGGGVFDPKYKNRTSQIRADYNQIYQN